MKSNINKKNSSMFSWMKDLFPFCRSITGEGIRKSLSYFEKINPEFKRIKFKTGKKVFDWTIPKEWNIKDGYIKHESGKKFCKFKENNLNIVGYSKPVNFSIDKNKLLCAFSNFNSKSDLNQILCTKIISDKMDNIELPK